MSPLPFPMLYIETRFLGQSSEGPNLVVHINGLELTLCVM
jgi:hypothetical protein